MALTSQYCQVHEASLLLAVRACFHIHLISKSPVNKTTAKAALTQMLSIVFQRMEAFDARSKAETEAALAALSRNEEEEAVATEKIEG
jgi:brefeldin A-inhibited guanine nucleotide-exchange protein